MKNSTLTVACPRPVVGSKRKQDPHTALGNGSVKVNHYPALSRFALMCYRLLIPWVILELPGARWTESVVGSSSQESLNSNFQHDGKVS